MKNAKSTYRGRNLGLVHSIPEYREFVDQQPELSVNDRKRLVSQATILIRDLYVHMPLKQAMHSINPVQRLRLLRHKLDVLSDREFHAEMIDIFTGLHDLHTNYGLPKPYKSHIAFLGILIEPFDDDGEVRWMVSKVAEHLVTDNNLKEGVLISHWNGTPMNLAVWRNAEKEAGSNPAARFARGLENMTLRYLGQSLTPDEDWVDLVYDTNGQKFESRLSWNVFESGPELVDGAADPDDLVHNIEKPLRYQLGIDQRTEIIRRVKKQLFSPQAVREEARAAKYEGRIPRSTAALRRANMISTSRPDEITAKIITTSSGTFGYLRIWTFYMKYHSFLNDAITQFIDEVERLLRDEFPPEGLVIDVRGNGGGYVFAADSLLQMLTPNMVTPEPAQFINTASTLSFTDQVLAWNKWHDSLLQGIQTGANYSHAFPLYLQEDINTRGQISHGPVVLITDAFCYSATDIFSAGFKDHAIGTIIGVDNATGAGGAVVLEQKELLKEWLGGPLKDLPNGATMRVSLVRTLRVGDRAGQPVEDLGVEPDTLVEMTQDDLLFGNRDLHEKSGAILAGGVPRAFRVEEKSVVGVEVTIKIMTLNIPQVDIYVNDRPIGMNETPDGTTTLTVEIPGVGSIIRLIGFENGKIVGAGQLVIN